MGILSTCVSVYLCVPGAHRDQKRSDSLNGSYRHLWSDMWVLRIEPWSPRRLARALNLWAMSPVQRLLNFENFPNHSFLIKSLCLPHYVCLEGGIVCFKLKIYASILSLLFCLPQTESNRSCKQSSPGRQGWELWGSSSALPACCSVFSPCR